VKLAAFSPSTLRKPRAGSMLALLAVVTTVPVVGGDSWGAPPVPEAAAARRPNIVFFITDDQDQMLGSSFPSVPDISGTPLPKTRRLLVEQGATFRHFFAHVPICNPSRSTTLTGRYFHNLRTTGTVWAQMHVATDAVHNFTVARRLKDAAGGPYATGLFGKYLNAMPPGTRAPPGWDAWLANGGGDYVAPAFVVGGTDYVFQNVSNATWQGTADDYTTAVVGNASVAWIRKVRRRAPTTPFFAYVAPKAAHEPFDPAPWYRDAWDPAWSSVERRGPAWNASFAQRRDHGSNVPTQPVLTAQAAAVVSGIWRNRWRTLMSVDDVVEAVHAACDPASTYFFYTSDHGFQLGHLNMLMDKRHAYDWDVRIPLVVKGPGIAAGALVDAVATNVDLAPTFLDLAGIFATSSGGEQRSSRQQLETTPIDGKSLAPLLFVTEEEDSSPARLRRTWRTSVPIEYFFNDNNTKCVANCTSVEDDEYPAADASCADLSTTPNRDCWGAGCNEECYPTESLENNFIALRRIDGRDDNLLYVAYETGNQTAENLTFAAPTFVELFDVARDDPWMLQNLATQPASAPRRAALHAELMAWFHCAGAACP